MLNILSTCSATVRKSLQGLDYIAANGSKAFDDLCAAVTLLQECGAISRESKTNAKFTEIGQTLSKVGLQGKVQ